MADGLNGPRRGQDHVTASVDCMQGMGIGMGMGMGVWGWEGLGGGAQGGREGQGTQVMAESQPSAKRLYRVNSRRAARTTKPARRQGAAGGPTLGALQAGRAVLTLPG